MSDLPADWEWASLADVIGAGVFSDGDWIESKDQDRGGDVRLLQLADIGEGQFRDRSNRHMTSSSAAALGCTYLESGDVLVARMPDPLGRACRVPKLDGPSVTAVDVCILRPTPLGVDPAWLMWTINSPQVRWQIADLRSGTTRMRISRKNLATVRLAVPPRGEQDRIVAAIEQHLSRLDSAEAAAVSAERRIKALEVAILTQGSSTTDPPRHWKVIAVADAGAVGLGLQRSPKRHSGPNMRPYLRVANVFEDRIDGTDVMSMDITDAEWERFRLREGDVLLNEGQSPELLGRPAIYRGNPPDVAFTNSLIRFQAGEAVDPDWALLVFRSHMHNRRFMRESQITTNIAHLAAGRFKTVEFPLPPLKEQRVRVAETRAQLAVCARLRSEVAVSRKRAASLRRSILAAAFAGRLVPQDSSDEPASVLLEQIRAERAAVTPIRRARTPAARQ